MSATTQAAPRAPTPPFTERHEAMRAEMRAWIAAELHPHAEEWEAARWFPSELFSKLAEVGWLGLRFPAEYGGADDPVAAAVWCEELSRCGSGGVASGLGAHPSIALPPIWHFGTDEQKERWLRPGLRGELIAALAITEPDAGSDVAGIRTRAVKEDGGWRVNGSKMFITGGVRADIVVTAVKTTAEGGHGGMSFLVIEKQDGVGATAIEKLGWHASDTALISLDDVWVPEENLLGQLDKGFYLIMANFQWERLVMAFGALGAMEAALDRIRAEGPMGQAARHRVAEMGVAYEAGRALTCHAFRLFLDGRDAVTEVTEAKLATQTACVEVVAGCLELAGPDPELERALCDARLGPIGGGTDEIMKEILGRTLGL